MKNYKVKYSEMTFIDKAIQEKKIQKMQREMNEVVMKETVKQNMRNDEKGKSNWRKVC